MDISCSIVIVNWKSIDCLINCINSIQEQTHCTYEIIVIDNDSGEKEQSELKQIKNIFLILNQKNVGFAKANNQGFKIARGKFIFMLNPDTIVLDNAINKLIDFLKENKKIFAAGPKLFYSEKLDHHPSIKTFQTPFSQFLNMLPRARIIKAFFHSYNPETTQRVDCVWGCAIMFRKHVFDKIGMLDEQFFIYTEELDFCKRMSLNDMPLYYYPEARVIHYGGKSQSRSSQKKNMLVWTSKTKYFKKYFSRNNILFSYFLLALLLQLKIVVFRREELTPAYEIIKDYIKCAESF
jgi:hypothetical protein